MNTGEWVGAAALLVAILGAVFAYLTVDWRRFSDRRLLATGDPLTATLELPDVNSFDLALESELGVEEAQVAPTPSRELYRWLIARGACQFGVAEFRLSLDSRVRRTIYITSIRAVVTERSTAALGAYVHSPSAGAREIHALGFDLGSGDIAEARSAHGRYTGDWSQESYFRTSQVAVEPEGMESFNLYVSTGPDWVDFYLEVEYSVGGRQGVMRFPADGEEALRVVGIPRTSFRQEWVAGVHPLSPAGQLTLVPDDLRRLSGSELMDRLLRDSGN